MNKRINFEDNIFILNTRIRLIRDLLVLDADPDLFLGKTLDDLDFINGALGTLLDNLLRHRNLIELEEQFYNLQETEIRFTEVLTELAQGEGTISVERFPVIGEKLDLLRAAAAERQKALEASIRETDQKTPEMVVSSDELQELLKGLE
jgi:hypothetical protein